VDRHAEGRRRGDHLLSGIDRRVAVSRLRPAPDRPEGRCRHRVREDRGPRPEELVGLAQPRGTAGLPGSAGGGCQGGGAGRRAPPEVRERADPRVAHPPRGRRLRRCARRGGDGPRGGGRSRLVPPGTRLSLLGARKPREEPRALEARRGVGRGARVVPARPEAARLGQAARERSGAGGGAAAPPGVRGRVEVRRGGRRDPDAGRSAPALGDREADREAEEGPGERARRRRRYGLGRLPAPVAHARGARGTPRA